MQNHLKGKDMPLYCMKEDVTVNSLIKHVEELSHNNEAYKTALKKYNGKEAIQTIIHHISEA